MAPGIHSELPVLTSVCVHQRLVVGGAVGGAHRNACSFEGKVVNRLRKSGATGRLGEWHRGQAARQWELGRVGVRVEPCPPPGVLAVTMQALSRCSVCDTAWPCPCGAVFSYQQ